VATSRGVPFVVLTNGTTRTPAELARTLRDIGFGLPGDAVATPASSAAALSRRAGYRRVLTLGHDGLAGRRCRAGRLVSRFHHAGPRGGLPRGVGWRRAVLLLPVDVLRHRRWPRAGTSRAISAMIQSMTGCRLHLVGKPSLHAFRCAAGRLGVPGPRVVVVGDDPELEVPMAQRGRALAVAVGTGIGTPGAFDHLPPARRPHLTLPGVADLLTLC